jgi:AraC-like DNA-binding protein
VAVNAKRHQMNANRHYRSSLETVTLGDVDLAWGTYAAEREAVVAFQPGPRAVVTHFRMSEPGTEFIVNRESTGPYELRIAPTGGEEHTFFELALSQPFIDRVTTGESRFLARLHGLPAPKAPGRDFSAPMTPSMYAVIADMRRAPFEGRLKQLYLEAKALELFLLQVGQLDLDEAPPALSPRDVEALREVRRYLGGHYDQPCSLLDLSRRAAISQTKLKAGFKALFGTTVFGYLLDLRMQEARRLLLEEKATVGEVADRVGYRHPHHFAAAFRRRYGVSPGTYKNK